MGLAQVQMLRSVACMCVACCCVLLGPADVLAASLSQTSIARLIWLGPGPDSRNGPGSERTWTDDGGPGA